ncbi:MAG: lipocalin family protein [Sediminispirochaetaceae bacterium]
MFSCNFSKLFAISGKFRYYYSMLGVEKKHVLLPLLLLSVYGHAAAGGETEAFHETVPYVDLERFAGDWYVIAVIPTPFEKNAVNGIENYSINEDGTIQVRYTFRKGSPGGKQKVMYQKGWIYNPETNADWRVRPIWPLKLPYYILELAEDYSYTVVGTNNYKYLWIMARKPAMDKTVYDEVVSRMAQRGYDTDKIQRMKQDLKAQE